MGFSGKKLIKKSFIMIIISFGLIFFSGIAYYFHFYRKNQMAVKTIGAEESLRQTEASPDSKSQVGNVEQIKDSDMDIKDASDILDLSIFDRKEFLMLKDYSVLFNFNKQEKILTRDDAIPPVIESVTVDDPGVGGRLNIFWKRVDNNNIKKVRIYRFNNEIDSGEIAAEFDNKKDFFVDKNLTNNHVYYYLVKNVSQKDIESKNTEKIGGTPTNIIPPNSPSDIAVEQVENQIEISWTNPADEDLAYIYVYRSENQTFLGDLVAEITAFPNKKHSLIDKNVESYYKEYNYTLIAVDNAGNKSPFNLIKYGNKELFIKKEVHN